MFSAARVGTVVGRRCAWSEREKLAPLPAAPADRLTAAGVASEAVAAVPEDKADVEKVVPVLST